MLLVALRLSSALTLLSLVFVTASVRNTSDTDRVGLSGGACADTDETSFLALLLWLMGLLTGTTCTADSGTIVTEAAVGADTLIADADLGAVVVAVDAALVPFTVLLL